MTVPVDGNLDLLTMSPGTGRTAGPSGQVPGSGVALRDPVGGDQAVSAGMSAAPISGSVVGTMVTLDRASTSRPR